MSDSESKCEVKWSSGGQRQRRRWQRERSQVQFEQDSQQQQQQHQQTNKCLPLHRLRQGIAIATSFNNLAATVIKHEPTPPPSESQVQPDEGPLLLISARVADLTSSLKMQESQLTSLRWPSSLSSHIIKSSQSKRTSSREFESCCLRERQVQDSTRCPSKKSQSTDHNHKRNDQKSCRLRTNPNYHPDYLINVSRLASKGFSSSQLSSDFFPHSLKLLNSFSFLFATLMISIICSPHSTKFVASQPNQNQDQTSTNQQQSQDGTNSKSSSSFANFTCPEQFGYYTDSRDCNKYYVCVFGEVLHESCTEGLRFSKELQTCDWPPNVDCPQGSSSSSTSSNSNVASGQQAATNSYTPSPSSSNTNPPTQQEQAESQRTNYKDSRVPSSGGSTPPSSDSGAAGAALSARDQTMAFADEGADPQQPSFDETVSPVLTPDGAIHLHDGSGGTFGLTPNHQTMGQRSWEPTNPNSQSQHQQASARNNQQAATQATTSNSFELDEPTSASPPASTSFIESAPNSSGAEDSGGLPLVEEENQDSGQGGSSISALADAENYDSQGDPHDNQSQDINNQANSQDQSDPSLSLNSNLMNHQRNQKNSVQENQHNSNGQYIPPVSGGPTLRAQQLQLQQQLHQQQQNHHHHHHHHHHGHNHEHPQMASGSPMQNGNDQPFRPMLQPTTGNFNNNNKQQQQPRTNSHISKQEQTSLLRQQLELIGNQPQHQHTVSPGSPRARDNSDRDMISANNNLQQQQQQRPNMDKVVENIRSSRMSNEDQQFVSAPANKQMLQPTNNNNNIHRDHWPNIQSQSQQPKLMPLTNNQNQVIPTANSLLQHQHLNSNQNNFEPMPAPARPNQVSPGFARYAPNQLTGEPIGSLGANLAPEPPNSNPRSVQIAALAGAQSRRARPPKRQQIPSNSASAPREPPLGLLPDIFVRPVFPFEEGTTVGGKQLSPKSPALVAGPSGLADSLPSAPKPSQPRPRQQAQVQSQQAPQIQAMRPTPVAPPLVNSNVAPNRAISNSNKPTINTNNNNNNNNLMFQQSRQSKQPPITNFSSNTTPISNNSNQKKPQPGNFDDPITSAFNRVVNTNPTPTTTTDASEPQEQPDLQPGAHLSRNNLPESGVGQPFGSTDYDFDILAADNGTERELAGSAIRGSSPPLSLTTTHNTLSQPTQSPSQQVQSQFATQTQASPIQTTPSQQIQRNAKLKASLGHDNSDLPSLTTPPQVALPSGSRANRPPATSHRQQAQSANVVPPSTSSTSSSSSSSTPSQSMMSVNQNHNQPATTVNANNNMINFNGNANANANGISNGNNNANGNGNGNTNANNNNNNNAIDINKKIRPSVKKISVNHELALANNRASTEAARRPEALFSQPTALQTATKCDNRQCRLPDCKCGDTLTPGALDPKQVPQVVLLTFDDAVNDLNWEIYEELFNGRVNPNGCPILATFYVSHEWTDYGQVQTLYSRGHEMASHSVTHSFGEKFSKSQWFKEINGQREILNMYGGVKMNDVRGMRAPFLQIGGNKMFEMLYDANFTYDSSMPIFENSPPLWPYTLDYQLNHECMITPCPTKSFPGVWEVGMTMWIDLRGGRCSMADACTNPSDEEGVFEMLMKNFNRHYKSNKAPFGLYYHSAWFNTVHHRRGFLKFLQTVNAMQDVFFLTNWQMLQWMRKPTPLAEINSFEPWQCPAKNDRPPPCFHPSVCNVKSEHGTRFMKTCQPCPANQQYPWVSSNPPF